MAGVQNNETQGCVKIILRLTECSQLTFKPLKHLYNVSCAKRLLQEQTSVDYICHQIRQYLF